MADERVTAAGPLAPWSSQYGATWTLRAAGLASKWGFSDGDEFDDLCFDLRDEGVEVHGQALLIAAVRRWLLPAITADLDVYEIGTLHNPIRTRSVNGVEINDRSCDPALEALLPEQVEIPLSELLDLARSLTTPCPGA